MASTPQSILLVGGGQGIGLETTKYLLETTPSAVKLVVFGLHAAEELKNTLATAHADRLTVLLGDVTSATDRKKAVQTCLDVASGIDTMVYFAGVMTPIRRIDDMDLAEVRRSYEVNVFGVMEMCQLTLPHLRNSQCMPRIIILSSACDFDIIYRGWSAYCTSKAALTRFIHLLAHENPHVLVQGVYPRLTGTQMPADTIAGKYKGIMADEEVERFQTWAREGNMSVEPASWCGEAVARLAAGLDRGGKSGQVLWYDEHVPDVLERKKVEL